MRTIATVALIIIGSRLAYALEPMPDYLMSEISGRDGITMSLSGQNQISASQLDFRFDGSGAPILVDSLGIQTLNIGARSNGGNYEITTTLDAFTHNIAGGDASACGPTDCKSALALHTYWNSPLRVSGTPTVRNLEIDSEGAIVAVNSGGGLGNFALDTVGEFYMQAGEGLFDSGHYSKFRLNLGKSYNNTEAATLFYHLGGDGTLALDDLALKLNIDAGGLGIDSDGLMLKGSRADFNLTYNVLYDGTGGNFSIDASDDKSILYYGWNGGLLNPELHLMPGGLLDATDSYTKGLSFSLTTDFESDFAWDAGEAAGTKTYLAFSNWNSITGTDRHFSVPYLALDAVAQGGYVAPLCWGANAASASASGACSGNSVLGAERYSTQSIGFAPTSSAMAIAIRDTSLSAYSSRVDFYDDGAAIANENWALIYTFGDVDGNILLYPVQAGVLLADIAFTVQSFDDDTPANRWANGTHFMIGDTGDGDNGDGTNSGEGMAIGLVGSDLLFGAEKLSVAMRPEGLLLQSNNVRFGLRGLFGGGSIPSMDDLQAMFLMDMNLESDDFRFRLEPSPNSETFLGFSGYLSLTNLPSSSSLSTAISDNSVNDDGSYISLSEPSYNKLDVDIRFASISGDIEIYDGRVNLEPNSGKPTLALSSKLRVGNQVAGAGLSDDELIIQRVEFGGNSLGSIVIPGANIAASLTLKQQQ